MIKKDYNDCLDYIEKTWDKLTFKITKDKGIHFALPYPFVSPSDGCFNKDQFYWDSYFIILGLINDNKISLAKGMVENFFYSYKRFNIVPMRNRFFSIGISDPPFLTSMIDEVFTATRNKIWLKKATQIAEDELKYYWLNAVINEKHLVFNGLSRYCDHYIIHETAEHESGWDMTSRFSQKCLDYLPIDLNSNLYKYEMDLAKFNALLGDEKKTKYYEEQAKKRKQTIDKYLWNQKKGFYFDFNYKKNEQSTFYSLAGFFPLWSGMATEDQAREAVKNLKMFEYDGGLATTQKNNLVTEPYKQWDCPNGWANLHYIVVKGLLNYGYTEEAKRISKKWLDLNYKFFKQTGKMWERYDVVSCKIPNSERYPIQSGFGWTNGVFKRLVEELAALEEIEVPELFKEAIHYSRNRKRDKVKKAVKKIITLNS